MGKFLRLVLVFLPFLILVLIEEALPKFGGLTVTPSYHFYLPFPIRICALACSVWLPGLIVAVAFWTVVCVYFIKNVFGHRLSRGKFIATVAIVWSVAFILHIFANLFVYFLLPKTVSAPNMTVPILN